MTDFVVFLSTFQTGRRQRDLKAGKHRSQLHLLDMEQRAVSDQLSTMALKIVMPLFGKLFSFLFKCCGINKH